MRDKIGGFLALFLLLLTNLSSADLSPGDAYSGGGSDYEDYLGVKLGSPIAIQHPKDVKPVPAKGSSKIYRILAIRIHDKAEEEFFSIDQLTTLMNAERKPNQTRLQYQKTLPFGAKTSMRQYFLDQSNGKFDVSATVLDYEWEKGDGDADADEETMRILSFRYAQQTLGSLSQYDAVAFVYATATNNTYNMQAHGSGASEYDSSVDGNNKQSYNLPVQMHYATKSGLAVRELCIATAYTICKLPPLYPTPPV